NYRFHLAGSILLAAVSVVLQLYIPIQFGDAIDRILGPERVDFSGMAAILTRILVLTGTAAIIIISYVIRKLPYTVRSASAFLMQMDPSVEEASINLGVAPMKTFWKVTARLMLPGVFSGAILSWVTCINELSCSIMLSSGKNNTLTIEAYTNIVRNSVGSGAALSAILTITSAVILIIALRITKGKIRV
ncbi:MAG: ABC transporter permease subunit, partial [Oscillospiraceae bacterium]|nr:ABC transporter permease subunit [Oscillospiraceae bacterium]